MKKRVTALVIVAAVAAAAPTCAQHLSDSVQVHGFAGWAYGQTDGNTDQLGTEDGSYDNVNFLLNLNACLGERLMIAAQAE